MRNYNQDIKCQTRWHTYIIVQATLKRLFLDNGLVKEDVYKDKRGFVIITRTGIDKIVSKQNIQVAYEVIKLDKDMVVIKAMASMKTGNRETNKKMGKTLRICENEVRAVIRLCHAIAK